MALFVCLILMSVQLYSVLGYANGPPSFVCGTMTPSHGTNTGQNTVAPYLIVANKHSYATGDVIEVTLKGVGVNIKGFLLQARQSSGAHIGDFSTPPDTKTLACGSGNAVSHSTRLTAGTKTTSAITFMYTVPNQSTGDIQFVATVVQSFTTFWVKVQGPIIRPTAKLPLACTLPGNPSTLVELSRQSLSVSWKKPSSCATSCQVEFKVRAAVGTGAGNKYVSIGFSKDHLMGHDSVVDCIQKGASGTIGVQSSYNEINLKNNIVLPTPHNWLEFVSGSRVDGVLECVFKLSVSSANSRVFDLDARQYRLLVATGDVVSDVKSIHSATPTQRPVQSKVTIDFLTPDLFETLL